MTGPKASSRPAPKATPLARRMGRIKASAIREILKVTERPDVLSFAGGLPAPEAFPQLGLAKALAEVLESDAAGALQYGPTEGYAPLRAWVAQRLESRLFRVQPENVLITAGSQQGIDLVAKALLDPGDLVVVESPSYLAALQAFDSYEASFAVVESDEHGMRVDELEKLVRLRRPKLIYLVSTFQNPRGTTLSLDRRWKLARLSAELEIPVLEDDPYGELRYEGGPLPPVAALVPEAPIIYLSSFSKTLAPGLRVGYAVAAPAVIRALTVAKQASDLHTGSLSQRAIARFLETNDFDAHLKSIQDLYRARRDAMLAALARHFPAGTHWVRPEGGLFVWVQLPYGLDTDPIFAEALEEHVAFVPGAPFFPAAPRRDTLRLNFSNRPPELIEQGMQKLGAVVARHLAAQAASVMTPAAVVPVRQEV
jgi:2-aminoadipate transaminase